MPCCISSKYLDTTWYNNPPPGYSSSIIFSLYGLCIGRRSWKTDKTGLGTGFIVYECVGCLWVGLYNLGGGGGGDLAGGPAPVLVGVASWQFVWCLNYLNENGRLFQQASYQSECFIQQAHKNHQHLPHVPCQTCQTKNKRQTNRDCLYITAKKNSNI